MCPETMSPLNFSRHLSVSGTSNFRDLGGYAGHAGRAVRWRTLFRSDHLADLTPEGLQTLQKLGVVHALDFRGAQERQTQSYAWPQLRIHHHAIEPTVVQQAFALVQAGGTLNVADSVTLMQETYRRFVLDNGAQFAEFFRLLLESEGPLVFHCTAGKDRTGWAAALILYVLGVSHDDVQQDYLLTNQYYRRPAAMAARAAQAMPQEILNVLWRVEASFIDSAYTAVTQTHGSMEAYVREALGLTAEDRAELHHRYLMP